MLQQAVVGSDGPIADFRDDDGVIDAREREAGTGSVGDHFRSGFWTGSAQTFLQRRRHGPAKLREHPDAGRFQNSQVHEPWFLTFHHAAEHSAPIMGQVPNEFKNVTAVTKANVYFGGKVVSHTLHFPDGTKKTLGLIYPGQFHFGTDQAERMEIVAGTCTVKLDGQSLESTFTAGQHFDVPAKSGFDIQVSAGICEYICSFLG